MVVISAIIHKLPPAGASLAFLRDAYDFHSAARETKIHILVIIP